MHGVEDRIDVGDREALLTEALASEKNRSVDNYFYVEVNGRREDGTSDSMSGSWAADMAGPDTVVLRSEVSTIRPAGTVVAMTSAGSSPTVWKRHRDERRIPSSLTRTPFVR